MTDSPTDTLGPLPRPPLAEVILEIHWKLKLNGQPPLASQSDPGFKILLGRFYDGIRKSLPVAVDLPPGQIPEEMTPHTVRQQFRQAPDEYPLAQLGPGVFTYNHGPRYTWKSFSEGFRAAVDVLYSGYPVEIHPFQPVQIRLLYINLWGLKPTETVAGFLKDLLHVDIKIDSGDAAPAIGQSDHINLAVNLPIMSPANSNLTLTFADQLDAAGSRGLVWTIMVSSASEESLADANEVVAWAGQAHSVAKRSFEELCRGTLMEAFQRKEDQ